MISTRILIMPFQYWLGFVGSKINCSRKLPSKFTVENVSLFSACVHSIFFSVFCRKGSGCTKFLCSTLV